MANFSIENFKKILLSNKKYENELDKERHARIINTKREIIGVSMANIRKIAKTISKENCQEFLEFSKNRNFLEEYYEEILIEGLVIANLKDFENMTNNLSWWLKKIDSWAFVDSVCSTMKVLKNYQDEKYFDYFYNLCYSNQEFVARFGIISIMCNYLNEKYIDRIIYMCKNVANDAFYVQMGIAWLVSVCFVKFREKTFELIKSKTLSKFVQNKSISKCHDSYRIKREDKELLKKFRK